MSDTIYVNNADQLKAATKIYDFGGDDKIPEYWELLIVHYAKQKGMSRNPNRPEVCAYRGEGGKTCPVGFLLPDEYYHPIYDSGAILDNSVGVLFRMGCFTGSPRMFDFLKDHQCAHDSSLILSDFKRELEGIAWKYKLDVSLIESITEWSTNRAI